MKLPIRYFSIGILTSALIVTIILYFFDNTPTSLENESLDSIISFLEEDGYRVVSEEEYISLSVEDSNNQENEDENSDNASDDQQDATNEKDDENDSDGDTTNESNKSSEENSDDQSDSENEDEETNEEVATTYTLEVKPNMLSPEVSQLLVDNEIIDDAEAFTTYLEDEDYSKYIQLGKHDVSSGMSFNELAEEITSN